MGGGGWGVGFGVKGFRISTPCSESAYSLSSPNVPIIAPLRKSYEAWGLSQRASYIISVATVVDARTVRTLGVSRLTTCSFHTGVCYP